MLIALVTCVCTLLAVWLGWTLRKWATAPIHPQAPGSRVCGICDRELPLGTKRTHDGQWRCVLHKGA